MAERLFQSEGYAAVSMRRLAAEVGNFMVGEPFASQFQPMRTIFAAALGASVSEREGAEILDLVICLLHGVAHIHVTMSPYAWTDPARRVRLGITKILGAEPV